MMNIVTYDILNLSENISGMYDLLRAGQTRIVINADHKHVGSLLPCSDAMLIEMSEAKSQNSTDQNGMVEVKIENIADKFPTVQLKDVCESMDAIVARFNQPDQFPYWILHNNQFIGVLVSVDMYSRLPKQAPTSQRVSIDLSFLESGPPATRPTAEIIELKPRGGSKKLVLE